MDCRYLAVLAKLPTEEASGTAIDSAAAIDLGISNTGTSTTCAATVTTAAAIGTVNGGAVANAHALTPSPRVSYQCEHECGTVLFPLYQPTPSSNL
jgi:hypothetical protein